MEPKVSSNKGGGILKALGFDKWELAKGNGFTSGIWMVWKSSLIGFEIIQTNFQFVNARIRLATSISWLLTAMYVNLNMNMRLELWRDLELISHNSREPWVCEGDFNDI